MINDVLTGRTYWLEKGQFVSAPTQLDNTPDLDHIDFLNECENIEQFSWPTNFQHLIKILEKLVQKEVA
tara:strand:+ start:242 stop:448 length:207 start_codon:yes stop_codon:yes gene_type:complete